jgi:hypothetical protein
MGQHVPRGRLTFAKSKWWVRFPSGPLEKIRCIRYNIFMENLVWFVEKSGKRRKGIVKKCKICGMNFISPASRPYECCSVECKYKLITLENTIKVECAWCGKQIVKKKSKLNNSKSGLYFCDRPCKEKAQKIGGIREIMPSHYGITNPYKNLIKETEKPKCVGCPENRKYLLCIHHIDGNHENDSINNIEIVCGNCHIKRHLKLVNGEWIYSTHDLTSRNLLESL